MSPEARFRLFSPAFEEGKTMPTRFANAGVTGGKNISVPLRWENPPSETQSYVLACVDLHPVANGWIHWLVMGIPSTGRELNEGASATNRMPAGCEELVNSFGDVGYGGPQPPRGTGPHRYEFALYALNVKELDLPSRTSISAAMKALEGKVLAIAKTIGVFER